MSNQPTKIQRLGADGANVPALGFGLMGLSMPVYGETASDEDVFKILDRAYELGATNWDTSDLYGNSEETLGKWFKRTGKRNGIFLATKFGFVKGSKSYEVDSSGDFCRKACTASLEALGTDYIDLYYMHHANPETPIEETMRAMTQLKAEGKIKYIGLSAISSATLRRAVKIAPVTAVQVDYSPFCLDIEGPTGTDLLATCRELGVGIVAAMPLGRGMITSSFTNKSDVVEEKDVRQAVMPRFQEENRDNNAKVMAQFGELAKKKGCSVSQLSLAWLLKQGNDIFPIPGTRRIKYLEENWASIDVALDDKEEREIREFLENATIFGDTMPDQYKDYNFRDTVEEV